MKNIFFPSHWAARIPIAAAILCLWSLPAVLAQDEPEPDFTFDFNADPGDQIEIISNGVEGTEWRSSGGVDDSGYLSLTDAVNDARAAIIFEDPTEGKPIEGLRFSVDARIGGGTDPPADGFSVNIVRPDDLLLEDPRGEGYAASPTNEANLPEEGSMTGLGIGFDAWFSGGSDVIGFSVRVDGELVQQIPAPVINGDADDPESLQTGPLDLDDPLGALTWQPFEVELTPAGELTIMWKGQTILDALPVNYFPGPGQIVFGARTGGSNQHHHFDNLSLTILETENTVISGLTFNREQVVFQITDGVDGTLAANSVELQIDGTAVPVELTKEGSVTTITYTPETPFEIAAIHSYELSAMDSEGNEIRRSGSLSLPNPFFPIDPLPGPDPVAGMFATRHIWGGQEDTEINDGEEALDAILAAANGTWDGEFFDTQHPVINFNGGGIFGNDLDYPEEVATSPLWTGEDFVQFSRAFVRFAEPGDYTFGVHSDDGMGLRIHGLQFTSADGPGFIDAGDPSALIHPTTTGDSNTRGVLSVPAAGTHLLEFFWYERAGGDNGELYVSRGAITGGDDDPNAAWSLVGQSESVTYNVPGVDGDGWTVMVSEPGGDPVETIDAGLADIEAGATTENSDVVNFNDPGFGGPGTFGDDVPFPGDTEADDDDYAILATATLVIPATGTYHLGFRSDDGARLRVVGQTFDEIVTSAVPDSAVIEGDALIADVLTGDSNTVASIELAEGTYEIEFVGFERGGGSYFEVFGSGLGAPGNVLLRRDGAGMAMLEPAVSLVPAPAPDIPIVNFERDAGNILVDFMPLEPGADHMMQGSLTLEEWMDLETTITEVNDAVLRATAASIDPLDAYYRVVQLPPPPILSTGFEEGAEGWTVDGGVWEAGPPAGSLDSAFAGANVFATTLEDGYPAMANSGLRSPLVDLTDVTGPRLRFQYYQEMGQDEGVRLDFLDEDGVPLFDSDITFLGNSGGWVEFNRPFPAQARDRPIFLEFRLLTDEDETNDGFGFAIDEVLVSGN